MAGRPTKPSLPAQSQVLTQGLAIWRKSGAIQGGAACATCHSPDGIELAEYNFDNADLMRRARPHLGEADAQGLVAYIHALRSSLKIEKLRDPNEDRPLQPGGEVLAGASPAARDFAFGSELEQKLPLLFTNPVETLEEAQKAEAQLLAVSPTTLKIGIPLNRLSEDVAHGMEHSSIAQWLPESPPLIEEARRAEWYAAEDAYLANPTQEELRKLLVLHSQLVNPYRQLGLHAIATLKFRGLLVLQDRMRHHEEGEAKPLADDVRDPGTPNTIWEVGEIARQMMGRSPATLGMDSDTQSKKLGGPSLNDQLSSLRVSWFWAGWLSDQGLFKTSSNDKTRLGMWLSQSLSQDGPYPFHDVYANARRQAVISNDVAAWGEPMARRRRLWDFAGLRSFNQYLVDMPKDPQYRKLYLDFTCNCFRMNLLLLANDIRTSGEVWVKLNSKANVAALVKFIEDEDPSNKDKAERLQGELFSLIDQAKERI